MPGAGAVDRLAGAMKYILALVAWLLLQAAGTLTAQAATVYGSITGVVTAIYEDGFGDAPDGVSVNDPVYVTFSYESDALADLDPVGHPGIGAATYGAGLNLWMTIRIGLLEWTGSSADNRVVVLDGYLGANDRYEIELYSYFYEGVSFESFPGDSGGGNNQLNMTLSDVTGALNLTDSLNLPTSISDLDLNHATHNGGAISSNAGASGGGMWIISYEPDPQTLTLIPESSRALLSLLGLGAVLGRRRR